MEERLQKIIEEVLSERGIHQRKPEKLTLTEEEEKIKKQIDEVVVWLKELEDLKEWWDYDD